MDTFISVVLFILLFVFYIHIITHYKKGEDLEIYEMDYTNKTELQKVCNMNQPITFSLNFSPNTENSKNVSGSLLLNSQISKTVNPTILRHYEKSYVKVFDVNDYYSDEENVENLKYIYMPYSSSHILMKTAPRPQYFIQQNEEFMEDSKLNYKLADILDPILKPSYAVIVNSTYDICTGSKEVQLPLRYHNHYRRFYIVAKGKIHVKMAPYKSSRYLDPLYDINNCEHYSPFNVWKLKTNSANRMTETTENISSNDDRTNVLENVPFIEFDVLEGNVLYIPPYWWYSFKFGATDTDTILVSATYHSIMNVMAHSPEWIQFYMHQQRTNAEFLKKRMNKKTNSETLTTDDTEDNETNVEIEEPTEIDMSVPSTKQIETMPDDKKQPKITSYLESIKDIKI